MELGRSRRSNGERTEVMVDEIEVGETVREREREKCA